jgi:amino-acid N-acetyltransferase
MIIDTARSDDLGPILELLTRNGLPLDGLSDHLPTTLVAREDGQVVGSAALEIYPDGALLRSVAVSPSLQHRGLGQALTRAALALAHEHRVAAVYLLTTTADAFFPRFGFVRVTRQDVPDSVRQSVEFTTACPSTATVMYLGVRS